MGYKNHIKIDQKSKLIGTYQVTAASVVDLEPVRFLLTDQDAGQKLYADKAYTGVGYQLN